MKITSIFKSKHGNEVYQIKKKFNCNFNMAVYLIECMICRKQYNSSTKTKVHARANNYESTHRKEIYWYHKLKIIRVALFTPTYQI